jgi:hypothetical protein
LKKGQKKIKRMRIKIEIIFFRLKDEIETKINSTKDPKKIKRIRTELKKNVIYGKLG